ncbi:MAG: hypothetical protein CM15mP123_03670 [Gammaproteobacteria bacterium]|nr:MAG: hypothetical protein CM15mP123_03670 [Gammaproteobacteria bacterium]
MSRWFLIFLTSLLIVLGARYGTYSPLPTAVFSDCETPVAENKFQGLWELDRIDNYEAFHEALGQDSGFLSFIGSTCLSICTRTQSALSYRTMRC